MKTCTVITTDRQEMQKAVADWLTGNWVDCPSCGKSGIVAEVQLSGTPTTGKAVVKYKHP